MKEVVFIVGLPGSGKTYLANKEYVPRGYYLIDDPSRMGNTKEALHAMSKYDKLVICDPFLCSERKRQLAEIIFEGWNIKWIFFENDPEKCKELIALRNDARIINSLDVFQYTIPDGTEPLKIYEN